MTAKKSYNRYFIIFQEEDKGYGIAIDKQPTGYTKIETRNGRCKVTVYAQNLVKDRGPYHCCLIDATKNPVAIAKLGRITVDETGRGETWWEYREDDVAETGIPVDRFNVAAVIVEGDELRSPLAGYIGRDKVNWKDKIKPAALEAREEVQETMVQEEIPELDEGSRKFKEYEEMIKGQALKDESEKDKSLEDGKDEEHRHKEAKDKGNKIEESKPKAANEKDKVLEDSKEEEHKHKEAKDKGNKIEESKPKAANEKDKVLENSKEEEHKHEEAKGKGDKVGESKPKAANEKDKVLEDSKEEEHKHKEVKDKDKCNKIEENKPKDANEKDKTKESGKGGLKTDKDNINTSNDPKEETEVSKEVDNNDAVETFSGSEKENKYDFSDFEDIISDIANIDNQFDDIYYREDRENTDWEMEDDLFRDGKKMYGRHAKMFHEVLRHFKEVDNPVDGMKDVRWWRIPHSDDIPIRENRLYPYFCSVYHLKMTYPYINYIKYFKKPGYYHFGIKYDSNGEVKYIMYGIEGRNSALEQPYMGMTGFSKWHGIKCKDRDKGIWIMYYNPYTGCILIPKNK